MVALMLPTVLIHGGLVYLVNSGAVIGGDPIESRGIQLQQIARVAKYNPQGIPEDAAKKLAPSSTSTRWPNRTSSRTPTR